jgi:hypothetical protein
MLTQQKTSTLFGYQSSRRRTRMRYGNARRTRYCSILLSPGESLMSCSWLHSSFSVTHNRHPCNQKPSVVADIGLRLQEGIQDLKLEQQLAPAREAVVRTFSTGSTNFFKAVEGVRERWAQRHAEAINDERRHETESKGTIAASSPITEAPVEVTKSDASKTSPTTTPTMPTTTAGALRPFALGLRRSSGSNVGAVPASPSPSNSSSSSSGPPAPPPAQPVGAALSSWGAGLGSFISTRLARQTSSQAPPAKEKEKEKEKGDDSVRGSTSSDVDVKEVKEKEEKEKDETRERPESELVTPQPPSMPKVNITPPGGMTPVSGTFDRTPPSTPSTVGKTRVGGAITASGSSGRVRGAVLERARQLEREQSEKSPKNFGSAVRLPRDEDKAYEAKTLINSPPLRAISKDGTEHSKEAQDMYPQQKANEVHSRDLFAANSELHHGVDSRIGDGLQHRGSVAGSTYSDSIKSVDEQDVYAGMAL